MFEELSHNTDMIVLMYSINLIHIIPMIMLSSTIPKHQHVQGGFGQKSWNLHLFTDQTQKNLDCFGVQNINVQVEWEDQKNINAFNKLNSRSHELEVEVRALEVGRRHSQVSLGVFRSDISCLDLLLIGYL